jgi:hypothetical protein
VLTEVPVAAAGEAEAEVEALAGAELADVLELLLPQAATVKATATSAAAPPARTFIFLVLTIVVLLAGDLCHALDWRSLLLTPVLGDPSGNALGTAHRPAKLDSP